MVVVVGEGEALDEEAAEEDAAAEVMVNVWLFAEWILTTSPGPESAM